MSELRENIYDGPRIASVNGDVHLASTAEITVASGENIRVTFENPVGSGVEMHLFEFGITLDAGPLFPHLYINPDTGLPSTKRSTINTRPGGPSSEAVLKADAGSTALSGGTDTGVEFGHEQGSNDETVWFTVPEGYTLGINVALGTLSSGSGSLNLWYYEAPN